MRKFAKALIVLFIISIPSSLFSISIIADDSHLERYGESVRPIDNTNIRMLEENIAIDVEHGKTTCEFIFKNESEIVQNILMGFPDSYNYMGGSIEDEMENNNMSQDEAEEYVDTLKNFRTIIDGKDISVKKEKGKEGEKFKYPYWHTWDVSFQPNETKKIINTYDTGYFNDSIGEKGTGYILDTGRPWKGTIGKAKITFDFGNIPMSNIIEAQPNSFMTKGSKIIWEFKDFEPDKNIDVMYWGDYSFFKNDNYHDDNYSKKYIEQAEKSKQLYASGKKVEAVKLWSEIATIDSVAKIDAIYQLLNHYKNDINKIKEIYNSKAFKSFTQEENDYYSSGTKMQRFIQQWAYENIAPKYITEQTPVLKDKIICIDAGHQAKSNNEKELMSPLSDIMKYKNSAGGSAKSKSGENIYEYALNLETAEILQKKLTAEGAKVVMIRNSNDVNISNKERAEIANSEKCDLVIRVHCDGFSDKTTNGISLQYPSDNNIKIKEVAPLSKEAAQEVLNKVISTTNAKSRGIVEREDLTGFNWCEVPSILIESGFITNPNELELLITTEYQEKIADGIVDGVSSYFNKPNVQKYYALLNNKGIQSNPTPNVNTKVDQINTETNQTAKHIWISVGIGLFLIVGSIILFQIKRKNTNKTHNIGD